MPLEAVVRFGVVEDLLKRSVLQSSTVDIPSNPVIVKDRCTLGHQHR